MWGNPLALAVKHSFRSLISKTSEQKKIPGQEFPTNRTVTVSIHCNCSLLASLGGLSTRCQRPTMKGATRPYLTCKETEAQAVNK